MSVRRLTDCIEDPLFPETNARLRGYEFLVDAFPALGPFYERAPLK
jgi:hypothetical protein